MPQSGNREVVELLSLRGITVAFPQEERWVEVVRDLSLTVHAGEFVGLVGESGSGKSVTALSVLRLLPGQARILSGEILLDGEDLLAASERRMREVRGGRVGIVFQEPMTALNPVFTVGFQIAEAVRTHRPMSRGAALDEAQRLLELVAVADAGERLRDYPHQLSGGQRQRAMIAMALAAQPDLLIADEPTTALDVTIQAQILELLESLRSELGLAVLLITHDLGVVAETCDRAIVMYAGQKVEEAPVGRLFAAPAHPYTRGLLRALPSLEDVPADHRLTAIPGQPPDPQDLPSGCPFHPRCAEVLEECPTSEPALALVAEGQQARCFLHPQPERRSP